jgi:ribosomal-protein-alanine N-acetyltransferase
VPPALTSTPASPADLPFLCALLGDPRVGATLGGVRHGAEVQEWLRRDLERWERHGFGCRIWRDRATGEPVARGGLNATTVEGEPVVELAWAVVPERWGEGIATALGAASIAEATRLGIGQVVACALPHNAASRRVMEKLGLTYDRTFEHGVWGPHVLYRLETVPGAARRPQLSARGAGTARPS